MHGAGATYDSFEINKTFSMNKTTFVRMRSGKSVEKIKVSKQKIKKKFRE